jgi:S-adenosylmethionine:tRNA ribosyltransferase-isomerase
MRWSETRRSFEVEPDRIATRPPEERGLSRESVGMLVATSQKIEHTRFSDLGRFLTPGDLLVVNTSATRPAAIDGKRAAGRPVVVHLSTRLEAHIWEIELRKPQGTGPMLDGRAGEIVELTGGASAELLMPSRTGTRRMWRAALSAPGRSILEHLRAHGRPITYGPKARRWPLERYQTVFARHDGSAEMASAGRPFSVRLVTELVSNGITFAPITLHAGVSSSEAGEPPGAEWFSVPPSTASLVNLATANGRRVIAVGTTVTRALESATDADFRTTASQGWTDLVLGPDRPARVVRGLITGWHEADASHLQLLDAVAGPELVDDAYDAALEQTYLWHEFGDSCLLMP